MIESDGGTYQPCIYDKATICAPGKVGKTVAIVGGALAVLPNQLKNGSGAIVTSPAHLHFIAVDSSAFTDVIRFLIKGGAPEEIKKIRVYNMQDDVAQAFAGESDYDMGFYNKLLTTGQRIREIIEQRGGRHAIIMSGLTAVAATLERSVVGPPGSTGIKDREGNPSGKGYSDPSKWKAFAHQMTKIRSFFQVDTHHMIWEAHIDEAKKFSMKGDDAGVKESIAISGQTGRNWGYNTDHTYRLERQYGDTWKGTNMDKVAINTRPEIETMPGGRGQDQLKEREYDLSIIYKKLGLKRGGWGRKKESKVQE